MSSHFTPAYRLIDLISTKRLSAAELMKSTITRISEINERVNAIISLRDEKYIIAEAEARDLVPMDQRGVLHGLPIAIKDLANVKGLLTTEGSPIYANRLADEDDIMVQRIREAGAIFIGKTNTPEFGLGSHTYNPVFGTTLNPYDLTRSAGGSSGGAAVALATGMLSLADGSDMMGSLRNPAAWNNVYGMRPSWGLVPSEPNEELFLHCLSTCGPMARNPKDIALLLSVISGEHRSVPHSFSNNELLPVVAAEMTGKRVGWLSDWGGSLKFESGLLEATEIAVKRFEVLGAEVSHVMPRFSSADLWESWTKLRSWKLSSSHLHFLENKGLRNQLKPAVIWEIKNGQSLSALDINKASKLRSDWFARSIELFETYDFLVLPSTQTWPFEAEKPHPTEIEGIKMDTYHRWMEVVIPAGLIGLPVLNIPAGFGYNGLPFGLQLIGPRNSDDRLISVGQAWHEMTNWPDACPPEL